MNDRRFRLFRALSRIVFVSASSLSQYWRDSADYVFVLQNGIYRFNDKWKKRGIGKLVTRTIEHLDTVEKDGNLYQIMKVLRTNRLRSSILSGTVNDVGKFQTIERRVNLNADDKRIWFEKLTDVNDKLMIESMPILMGFFNNHTL